MALTKRYTAAALILAGAFVNLYEVEGVPFMRNADAELGYPADGFVGSDVAGGARGNVYFPGAINRDLSGLTLNTTYYLTTGGEVADEVSAGEGDVRQSLGRAISATQLLFSPADVPAGGSVAGAADIPLTANSIIIGDSGGDGAELAVAASRIVARLASGDVKAATASELKTLLAIDAADVSNLSSGMGKKYTGTVANCSNTASETTVFTAAIGANEWADGEFMYLNFYAESKQNSGGSLNFTAKVKYGASSFTIASAVAVADAATVGKNVINVALQRIGSDILVHTTTFFPAPTMSFGYLTLTADAVTAYLITAQDFATEKNITVTAQWSGADANAYFNVVQGSAYKI